MAENERISKSLREKLNDLSMIYKAYEERTERLFKDADDIITFGAKKIIKENLYKDKKVYISKYLSLFGNEISSI